MNNLNSEKNIRLLMHDGKLKSINVIPDNYFRFYPIPSKLSRNVLSHILFEILSAVCRRKKPIC